MTTDSERQFLRFASDEEACRYVATKVRQARRTQQMSQQEFAALAEVPLRTYKRFETHGRGSLDTFIRVLRAMGRTQYLFMLFPMPEALNPRESLDEKLKRLTRTQFQ